MAAKRRQREDDDQIPPRNKRGSLCLYIFSFNTDTGINRTPSASSEPGTVAAKVFVSSARPAYCRPEYVTKCVIYILLR